MFGQVGETNLDLKFGLFGIPVRIHPLFWLIGILLGLDTLRAGPEFLMAWLLVLLVSILVHELGHASVAKYFGFRPHIVLHSLGGYAAYAPVGRYNRGQSLAILFAGPGAGFIFGAISLLAGPPLLRLAAGVAPERTMSLLYFVEANLVWVNIIWSAVNLLPVFPLDGGQICRDILTYFDRRQGVVRTYWVSVIVGGLTGAYFLSAEMFYPGILFLLLAFQSYQALQMSRWQ
ncbi:MAG: site-2 protease family protein [Planctomycetaceae bacterium]|nr:site-2 protease family protein [Planctomycetaceae bacterium]